VALQVQSGVRGCHYDQTLLMPPPIAQTSINYEYIYVYNLWCSSTVSVISYGASLNQN